MTRKRFIKLAMSQGYSHGQAAGMAKTFEDIRINDIPVDKLQITKSRVIGASYDRLWRFFMAARSQGVDPWLALLGSADEALMILARYTVDSLKQAIETVTANWLEFARNFDQHMKAEQKAIGQEPDM